MTCVIFPVAGMGWFPRVVVVVVCCVVVGRRRACAYVVRLLIRARQAIERREIVRILHNVSSAGEILASLCSWTGYSGFLDTYFRRTPSAYRKPHPLGPAF